MEKSRLLILLFLAGLILMGYSWYASYPITVDSVGDFVFNHVPLVYWCSLSLLLASMFMIAVTSKNDYSKWMISVGIVLTIYSLSYFYSMLPTGDSQYFRGMTEYFTETRNLDPSQPNHSYYQWPSFFILSYISTSISGLPLESFEFILYMTIGFLLATALHVHASKAYKNVGFLAVMAFFVSMFLSLNYQSVPFSLAFGLLLLVLMLETSQKGISVTVVVLVLFMSMSITHAFVPLFLVLYLLIRSILDRTRQNRNLFLFTLVFYLLIQLTLAQFSFERTIVGIMKISSQYSPLVEESLSPPVSAPIDKIAQMLSRTVTIAFTSICVVGFFILLVKRKMRTIDKAILLTGAIYSGLGTVLNTLGERAIPIAFIPISLGAAHLLEIRFRPYYRHVFSVLLVVLLMMFPSVLIHQSFTTHIRFQTQEAHRAENFFVDHYDWTNPSFILANYRVITYLESKFDITPRFSYNLVTVEKKDMIFYTLALGQDFFRENRSMMSLFQKGRQNIVYNNGFSYTAMKAQP